RAPPPPPPPGPPPPARPRGAGPLRAPAPPSFPGFFSAQAHRLRHLRARHPADSHLPSNRRCAPRDPSRGDPASQAGFLNERTT
ncbi:hypothetical protein K6W80_41770, partial [Burkholderia contaminans]|uniref:hypothetical protein n=1 Tax=Burkholderia contaminans TaxID=488447 RepID=UPI001C95C6EF